MFTRVIVISKIIMYLMMVRISLHKILNYSCVNCYKMKLRKQKKSFFRKIVHQALQLQLLIISLSLVFEFLLDQIFRINFLKRLIKQLFLIEAFNYKIR